MQFSGTHNAGWDKTSVVMKNNFPTELFKKNGYKFTILWPE